MTTRAIGALAGAIGLGVLAGACIPTEIDNPFAADPFAAAPSAADDVAQAETVPAGGADAAPRIASDPPRDMAGDDGDHAATAEASAHARHAPLRRDGTDLALGR